MITVGSRLGGYTVLRLLGQGGMGQVYLAQHNRIARQVAVKVLLPELSSNQSVIERFFTEAQATSLIRHPGIVEVLDCDVLDGQAYIVMEYLEGESLAAYLARIAERLDDVPFALAVVAQVAVAVGAAHGSGIIHRDLKPDNVFLRANPQSARVVPKVLDFGIAKVALQGALSQTRTGAVIGTPAYMSPEQCRGGSKAVDGRSDVYSLGCILYEAICGRPPFVREGMGEMIVAHMAEMPDDPRQLAPGLPQPVADLVAHMLAKSPDDRPPTMEMVSSEILRCLSMMGVPTPPADIEPRRRVIFPVREGPSPISALTPGALTPAVRTPGAVAAFAQTSSPAASPAPAAAATPAPWATPSPVPGAGGTRVLRSEPAAPAASPTTFRGAAGEETLSPDDRIPTSRRWLVPAVAGGAALIGAAIGLRLWLSPRPDAPAAAATALAPAPAAPVAAPAAPQVVTIDVRGLPAQAEVALDGAAVSQLPLKLKRDNQRHRLLVRATGYRDQTLEIEADRDRIVQISMAAAPVQAAPPEPPRAPVASAPPPTPARRVPATPPTSRKTGAPPAPKPTKNDGSKSNYDDM